MRLGLILALFAILFSSVAIAQEGGPRAAPTTVISVSPLAPMNTPSPRVDFNALKSTNAYLAEINGAARARSDSYFEGGYVLGLVDAVYAIIVSAILLWLRISAQMRNFAQRVTSSRFWQVLIYVVLFVVLTTVMTLPLTIYENFYREHVYGLSNQNFIEWLGDFGTAFALQVIGFAILATTIYAVIRGTPRLWWLWGTLVAVGFLTVLLTISPVFISPLFNHYQPLKEGPLKSQILSLARAEGVPATNVYEFDASRQSKRISANVSGLFGTTRISMNDNLLKRCTPDQIIAVLGHEMGHYVLNHGALLITWFGLLIFVGFAFVNWGFGVLVRAFGASWDVKTVDDPAGLPVLMALMSVFMLVSTPVSNTITRTVEAQADIFGLNAVRKPDGFAQATLMLSDYRKLDPSPLEEFVFYDHPSGRTRIATAMRWKAEHLEDWDIKNGPVSPK